MIAKVLEETTLMVLDLKEFAEQPLSSLLRALSILRVRGAGQAGGGGVGGYISALLKNT